MEPLGIYNELKSVPQDALREIKAGRLKGKSDISPQWRLEKMTEVFGPIGFGWSYRVTRAEMIHNEQTKETACFVDVELTVIIEGKTSLPIFGTGGSMFAVQETSKMYCSDECYKMALTDALSVAMKQLGMASDVYRGLSDTKYDAPVSNDAPAESKPKPENDLPWLNETMKDGTITKQWENVCDAITSGKITSIEDVRKAYKVASTTAEKIKVLIQTK